MTVSYYKYNYDYYINLKEFYNSNLQLLTITQKCKICDELKRLKELLKLK